MLSACQACAVLSGRASGRTVSRALAMCAQRHACRATWACPDALVLRARLRRQNGRFHRQRAESASVPGVRCAHFARVGAGSQQQPPRLRRNQQQQQQQEQLHRRDNDTDNGNATTAATTTTTPTAATSATVVAIATAKATATQATAQTGRKAGRRTNSYKHQTPTKHARNSNRTNTEPLKDTQTNTQARMRRSKHGHTLGSFGVFPPKAATSCS